MRSVIHRFLTPERRPLIVGAFALVAAALLWRLAFLLTSQGVIDDDEGVVGLMVYRIREGRLPIYFLGQHYLGSAEAFLAAIVSFFTGGAYPVTLKITAALLSLFYAFTLAILVRAISGSTRAAWLAAMLALFGPAFLTYWGMKTRGGFLLVCALGNLVLLQTWWMSRSRTRAQLLRRTAVLGLLAGFAWYTYALVLAYFVASALWFLLLPSRGRRLFLEPVRIILSRRRVRSFDEALDKSQPFILEFLAFIFCTAPLLFFVLQMTSTDAVLPLDSRRVSIVQCIVFVLLIPAITLALKKPLPIAAVFTVPFLIGMLPAIVYLWFEPSPWYVGRFRADELRPESLVHLVMLDLPLVLTTRDPKDLTRSGFEWLAVLLLFWVAMLVLPLLSRGSPRARLARRSALMLWMLLVAAGFLSVTSGAFSEVPRHLLPALTALLGLAALFLDSLWRVSRWAAIGVLAVLIALNGWFTFRERGPEVIWPAYIQAEFEDARSVLEAEGIRHLWHDAQPVLWELTFSLGPEYRAGIEPVYNRTPEYTEEILSSRYAIVTGPEGSDGVPEEMTGDPEAWRLVPFQTFGFYIPPGEPAAAD